MVNTMGRVADAFWRAAAYCLHPRVIMMSLLPLLFWAGLAFLWGYFYWEASIDSVRNTLASWHLLETSLTWLSFIDAPSLRAALAPLLVLAVIMPVIVVVSLVVVALMMAPALCRLVASRRYSALERKRGAPFWMGPLWSLWCGLLALLALLVSMPLWLIPPLVLILPPLIWSWLGFKVFSFDALAEHASKDERRQLMREHRMPLMVMGLIAGYMSAVPAAIFWAVGLMAILLFPFLVPVAVWLHMLIFAFTTLWFTHYLLGALQELRNRPAGIPPATQLVEVIDPAPPLPPAL